jgi:hypothetical protein
MISKSRKLHARKRRQQFNQLRQHYHRKANRSVHHRLRLLKKRWLNVRRKSECWVVVGEPLSVPPGE